MMIWSVLAAALAAVPLTPNGWGALRVGMQEAEAERRMGFLPAEPFGDTWRECHERQLAGAPELYVMIQEGRVTRISIYGGPHRTDRGFGIGSREADVRRAYGRALEVAPHAYDGPPARYLTSWTTPGRLGVRYETDARGLVSAVHVGDESIRLIEGCA